MTTTSSSSSAPTVVVAGHSYGGSVLTALPVSSTA
jgi:hypothetical protein